nr:MAG TPA: hypothetical protein [Bacteriophage sp.]
MFLTCIYRIINSIIIIYFFITNYTNFNTLYCVIFSI